MGNYLGLDLGTSSLKALLVDENQLPLATVTVPLTVERPQFGWSEQDPASWIEACRSALSQMKATHAAALAAVEGIGLSGHMHGATILGDGDEVLRPCILWNDTRSFLEAAELDDEDARRITGNIVFPGFTAPKLLWVQRNEPAIFTRIRRVLLPKDYLRLWLTGEAVSEMSDAAGTSWLDTGGRRWSERMLARTGLGVEHMPGLVEGSERSGMLRPELGAEWGIGRAVVAGGGGDNAASACGVGVVKPGTGFLSLGTSGVLFTASAAYEPRPETAIHTFCHALPDTWHQMGVTLSAAACVEWLSQLLNAKPAELTGALGETCEAPAGRLTFLPYLSGERTPHNDAETRGVLVGLEASTDRQAMTRAVLDGVAFSMRDCLDAGGGEGSVSRLVAVGAGSRSAYWLDLMANALQCEIALPAAGDFGAALGAARLGLVAATGEASAAVMTEPPTARVFQPRPALRQAFADAHARYRALYPAIRGWQQAGRVSG